MTSNHEITTLNVSLPQSMRAFVEAQVAQRGYTSASEYMRELIRAAQREQEREQRFLELALQGEAVHEAPPGVSKEDWQELRRNILGVGIEDLRRTLASAARELDRGEGQPLDVAEVKSEGRRRKKRRRGA